MGGIRLSGALHYFVPSGGWERDPNAALRMNAGAARCYAEARQRSSIARLPAAKAAQLACAELPMPCAAPAAGKFGSGGAGGGRGHGHKEASNAIMGMLSSGYEHGRPAGQALGEAVANDAPRQLWRCG